MTYDLVQKLKYSACAFAKFAGWGEQADNQVSIVGEIVEVTGMDQHRSLAEQCNRQVLVGSGDGYAQYGIPSSFNLQTLR